MLKAVGRFATRRARPVLVATLFVLLAAGAFGASAVPHLSSGGFTDPSSPSTKADALLASQFHQGEANLVFLVGAPGGVNGPAARSVGTALARDLAAHPYVSGVSSYWSAPPVARAALESRDGHYGLVTASVAGSDSTSPARGEAIATQYSGDARRGDGQRRRDDGRELPDQRQVSHDLGVAESVAVPLTLLALLMVFGTALAALLPLVIGGVAIVGTLAVLRLLTLFVPVSVFALNLTTALGLGLAIDYSLFILSRYREERRAGRARRRGGPRRRQRRRPDRALLGRGGGALNGGHVGLPLLLPALVRLRRHRRRGDGRRGRRRRAARPSGRDGPRGWTPGTYACWSAASCAWPGPGGRDRAGPGAGWPWP